MVLNWNDYSIHIALSTTVLYEFVLDETVRDSTYVKLSDRKWVPIDEFNYVDGDIVGLYKDGLVYVLSDLKS